MSPANSRSFSSCPDDFQDLDSSGPAGGLVAFRCCLCNREFTGPRGGICGACLRPVCVHCAVKERSSPTRVTLTCRDCASC